MTAEALPPVIGPLRAVLEDDRRIAYAMIFGSIARGGTHAHSDVDVAIDLAGSRELDSMELGELNSRLEAAAGRPIDLVLLEQASPGLAYRVFRDGRAMVERRFSRPRSLRCGTRSLEFGRSFRRFLKPTRICSAGWGSVG